MTPDALTVTFGPLVPWPVVAALGTLALAAVGYALARRARAAWWRALALGLLVLALANPSIVAERREPRSDVVVVAVDRTASQDIGDRTARTDAAERGESEGEREHAQARATCSSWAHHQGRPKYSAAAQEKPPVPDHSSTAK